MHPSPSTHPVRTHSLHHCILCEERHLTIAWGAFAKLHSLFLLFLHRTCLYFSSLTPLTQGKFHKDRDFCLFYLLLLSSGLGIVAGIQQVLNRYLLDDCKALPERLVITGIFQHRAMDSSQPAGRGGHLRGRLLEE